ncbi:MAG: flagellar motor protein MotB, partial [Candidatus Thioglobus sp.]|nr:flagellar motor protein MotB [Candidatus Thioglobus sp.]
MIKTIFLITTVSLLSACSITKDSEPAVVEDRSSVTQESIITFDESSFESQSIVGASASLSSAERVAVTELKNTGTNFILYFSYDGFDIDESATAQI